jgi:hypothetical protein
VERQRRRSQRPQQLPQKDVSRSRHCRSAQGPSCSRNIFAL